MAKWTIANVGDGITVTYLAGGKTQQCGKSELVLADQVEAWVMSESDPGDLIVLPSGVVVVRQRAPATPA